jgi:tetratricopeptide (TPR) repeat protein
VNLAGGYLAVGNAKKVLELVPQALATWNQVLPPNSSLVVYALGMELLGYEKLKEYHEAEALVPEVLGVGVAQLSPSHPDRIILLNVAASLYVAEKKYEKAASLLKEGVEISKRALPAGHPVARILLTNYSYVLGELGRKDEASRARAESQVLLAFPERSDPLAPR